MNKPRITHLKAMVESIYVLEQVLKTLDDEKKQAHFRKIINLMQQNHTMLKVLAAQDIFAFQHD